MWKIQLFELNFDHKEKHAIEEVLKSKWLAMGERVSEFEKNFENLLGDDVRCNAVSSCTAALHLGLMASDVSKGDEVIIPSLTFISAPNVVTQLGATPILSDCKSIDHWNMSIDNIEKLITPRTKAIMVVHYSGVPCSDIQEIKSLCDNKNIKLIEDAAHAPGAELDGKKCGTFGDIGCFSFYSNKNISIGEGGMTSTKNIEIHEKLRAIRAHGMNSVALDRHKGRSFSYDITHAGLNYRMDEIRAAIGSVQLSKLDNSNLKRQKNYNHYVKLLENSDVHIPFLNENSNATFSYHIMPILLPENINRKEVVDFLKKDGIQSSMHYPPFWDFSSYKNVFNPQDTPITEIICRRQLTLPLYPDMQFEEIEIVVNSLKKAIN